MTTRTATESPADARLASAETVVARPAGIPGMSSVIRPRRQRGLATRFSVAAAALVLVTLGLSLALGTWRANRVAQRSIRDDLAKVPAVLSTYLADLQSRMRNQVRSLAGEPGTKAIFDTGVSTSTRHAFALDFAEVLDARTVFLFSPDATVLDRSDRAEGQGLGQSFAGASWVSEALEEGRETSAVIREGNFLSIVAAAPVRSGASGDQRLDGLVAATFPLDEHNASALQGFTRGELGILVNAARRGEPPHPAVSAATPGFARDGFGAAFLAMPTAVTEVFSSGRAYGPFLIHVGGERRLALVVPVKSSTGESYGALAVTRAVAAELSAFRQIRTTLLVVGALTFIVVTPLAFALGRRIAAPMQQLASGAIAIREGNLDVALPEAGADEVGVLARAFRAMVVELKEKRALEELVASLSDGRASRAGDARFEAGAAEAEGGPVVGEVFARRYRVRSLLGTGAMGSVYLARDLELDEDVALKVLTSRAIGDGTTAVQNLKSEIRHARRITHPNVVRVHDLGESQGTHFLTMEHVPGITLRQVTEQQGRVALAPGLQIAKQLCRGLAAVHESGIVHRDIKPQNIMVLPNGLLKLMDFGIARVVKAPDLLAEDGIVVGTPNYMPPEQILGSPVDARSDIYSVGAVLFEMFTGELPFTGPSISVLRQHVSSEPPRPGSLRPGLPAALERLILACLAKQPDQRPASAHDLYAALMRIELPDA